MEDGDRVLLDFRRVGTRLCARRRDNRNVPERNREGTLRIIRLNRLTARIQHCEVAEELGRRGLARRFGVLVNLFEHFLLFLFTEFPRFQRCPLREHTGRGADFNLDAVQLRVQHLRRIGRRAPARGTGSQILCLLFLRRRIGRTCAALLRHLPLYVLRKREVIDELGILPVLLGRRRCESGRRRRNVQGDHCRTEHSGQQTL